MRRILTLVAIVLAAVPAGTAHAATPTVVGASCGFVGFVDNASPIGTSDALIYVVFGAAVAVDAPHVAGNPATVSMFCTTTFNGMQPHVHSSLPTLAATVVPPALDGYGPVAPTDVLNVCTSVTARDSAGTGGVVYNACSDVSSATVPPDEVCEILPAACAAGQVDVWWHLPEPIVA